ncbi:hypothetical protein GCM10010831_16320 [Psychroflexus salis]|uniref:CHAT domain-containing protein n=1 Tax=Psychroflexus salis TaxID=1526574 RepID=A0A916ZV83_9FLAO|nr:hypothetical protein GCM10010831_16320 [Psychroflexus salis]
MLYDKELNLEKTLKKNELTELSKIDVKLDLADVYLQRGKLFQSLQVLNEIIKEHFEFKLLPKQQAKAHLGLANTYDKIIEVDRFLEHTEKFRYYFGLAYPDKEIYEALYYSYISRYYSIRMLHDKANLYARKSLSILHKNINDSHLIAVELIYLNYLFSLRNYSDNFELKKSYRDTIEIILNKKYAGYHTQKSEVKIGANMFLIDTLSNSYIEGHLESESHKQLSKQLSEIFEEQIESLDQNIGYYNLYSSRYQSLLGLVHFYNNDFTSALKNYEKSIYKITGLDQTENTFSAYNFMLSTSYLWKARSLNALYEKTKNIDYLVSNEKNLNELKKTWQLYIDDRINDKNDFNRNNYLSNPYPTIQNNYIQLYLATHNEAYKEDIFISGELSKNYTFQHLIEKSKIQPNLYNDNTLKYVKFENFIDQLNHNGEVSSLAEYDFGSKIQQETFIPKTISSSKLKENQKSNQALISYSEFKLDGHDTKLLAHLISRESDSIIYLDKISNEYLNADKNLMNQALDENNIEQFQKYAHEYYKRFLLPVEQQLNPKVEEIVIVPSPSMERLKINFSTLITDIKTSKSYKNLSYIGEKYAFSYANTAKTAYEQIINDQPNQVLTIFVPNSKEVPELIYTDNFLKKINKKYKVNLILNDDANKSNFIKHLEKDQIVMLISHGIGRNTDEIYNNGLFLSDDFLSIEDIKLSNSSCELLILAGCSTGVGFGFKDGMISFGRTMTLFGVDSVLLTTHDVDEASTLDLIEKWFYFLSEGETKAKALQRAQKKFLRNITSNKSSPKYWAGLKLVGNTKAIQLKKISEDKNFTFIILIIVGTLLFILLIFRKFRK